MAVSKARWQGTQFLFDMEKDSGYADQALQNRLAKANLSRRDAALCTRICFGVLENETLLDFYIGHFSSVPPQKMHPKVRIILRAGAYQILFLDKIPPSAAVNEAVLTAKATKNGKAAGFINAVLRRISEAKHNLPKITAATEAERLAILYSHPLWLVEKFAQTFGMAEAEALLAENNQAPPAVLRVNTLKATQEMAEKALLAEDVLVSADETLPNCLYIAETGPIDKLSAFTQGLVTVQDKAAQLASLALAPAPYSLVIDGCAAPGGKSVHMAALMENKGRILAFDVHEHKLAGMAENASRLGVACMEIAQGDALVFRPELAEKAQFVMADVPCSNLGIIRKKPDIRRKSASDLAEIVPRQQAILQNLSRYVAKGGVLLYVTCTVLPEENEENVALFLQNNKNFALEPFFAEMPPQFAAPLGMLTLLPHKHGTDGFFMARLRKNG